jgi:hypothetical protein
MFKKIYSCKNLTFHSGACAIAVCLRHIGQNRPTQSSDGAPRGLPAIPSLARALRTSPGATIAKRFSGVLDMFSSLEVKVLRFIMQKLKLKVNEAKSAMARPQERKFLGFSFSAGPDIKRTIAPKSLERFKRRIRDITSRAKGVSIKTTMEELAPYMRGWRDYFGFCEDAMG